MVIWLIGLAGAGKTTLGREVHARLRAEGRPVVLLDGDHFREIMGGDLGHSLADREQNGWRMARMCHWLESQGVDVVCCILSNFPEQRAWNRAQLEDYLEVFIDVPLEELEARDQKGLYSGARAGRICNVVGVDIEFQRPDRADLVLHNDGSVDDLAGLAGQVVAAARDRKSA